MIQNVFSFLLGVYIGQEFGSNIPSFKDTTKKLYSEFEKTEFYKNYLKK